MSFHSNFRNNYSKSLFLLTIIFCLVSIAIAARFFDLQIKHGNYYKAQAASLHGTTKTMESERGIIYLQDKDHNLQPAAMNKKFYDIFAVPKEIQNPQEVAKTLSPILGLKESDLLKRLEKSSDSYEPLINKFGDEEAVNKIKDIKGIYATEKNYRYYPFKEEAAQVIGFVGYDEEDKLVGRYGLEKYYNDVLAGKAGTFSGAKDAFGRLIRSVVSSEQLSQQGASLVSTIDKNIDFQAREEIKKLVESRQAENGSVIIMDPKTGKILAMDSWPSYDPNKYSEVKDISVFRNTVVEDRFELGSVMKVVTMAIGLETKALTPQTTYTDTGIVKLNGREIRNFQNHVYGKVDMTRVLEMSINTGAVQAESLIGNDIFRKYLDRFELGLKSGVDLPDEVSGDLSPISKTDSPQINFASAAFGQGIAMNPLVLAKAYAVIANHGKSVYPYVVEKIIDDKGNVSTPNLPEPTQIVSEKTAEDVTSMMVKVVENGYGKNAAIKGYSIAGKTGTAQIPIKGGGYSQTDTIQTFYGFFPASNPQFVIAIKLDNPKTGGSASETVTYAFRNLVLYLINYYNIPPDNLSANTP